MAIGHRRARFDFAIIVALAFTVLSAAPAQARPLDRRGLVQTFSDEFDTLNLADPRDPQTWTSRNWKTWYANATDPYHIFNRTLPANGEGQAYVDDAWPPREPGAAPTGTMTIVDGVLRIRGDRAPEGMKSQLHDRAYTSGVLVGWGMFAQRYGVFEARLKLPKGQGLWPAFWMVDATGNLPNELDIMEFLGRDVHTTYSVAHFRQRGRHVSRSRDVPHAVDVTRDFHVFAVDWRPATVTYYIDDEAVLQIPTPPDMHNQMYMILNLAVGGKWGGQPDATTPFPAYYDVDWVRAWRRPGEDRRPSGVHRRNRNNKS